jgi:hypothetical protein
MIVRKLPARIRILNQKEGQTYVATGGGVQVEREGFARREADSGGCQ